MVWDESSLSFKRIRDSERVTEKSRIEWKLDGKWFYCVFLLCVQMKYLCWVQNAPSLMCIELSCYVVVVFCWTVHTRC